MGKKRILAYYMHEPELAEASKHMTNVEATDSYLLGDIEESDIGQLQSKGLICQQVQTPAPQETPTAEFARAVAFRSARAAARAAPPPPAAAVIDPNNPNFYLLRVDGPLVPGYRRQLEAVGAKPSERVADGTYIVKLNPAQITQVQALPFVVSLTLYGPTETELAATAFGSRAVGPPPQTGAIRILTFDVQLHDSADLGVATQAIKTLGLLIAGAKGRKIRFHAMDDAGLDVSLAAVRAIPQVRKVEPYVEPELHNDLARVLLGIDPAPGGNPAMGLALTGAGQIVAVADTGIDHQHQDFQGRIVGRVGLGRPGDTSDPHGHGTHVAGSVLGDGTASNGKIRGVAPAARLYFQSLLDAMGRLGGLPLDLADLFEDAYQNGARIHNNSWGAVVDSEYTMNSLEVDEFVARRRDMLVVISAGNEGQGATLQHAQQGFVEWLSIGAPATSKNALTVGASRSSRTNGGYSTLTYGVAWPNEFPVPPIAGEQVSGNPNALAAFSSRGPCTDRRVKPDVVAPGTDILSPKSSHAPLHRFWGPGPSPHYAFMGGTSMAAPLVAGCAALVREYYTAARNHQPSAALLKATLINSTGRLTGADAIADFDVRPNMHQGFGAVQMPFAVPNAIHPQLRLEFVDDWTTPNGLFVQTGQFRRFQVSVSAGMQLSVCLTWTDAPGRALQNNLNLIVETPGGAKFSGNENLPMALGPLDQENNIEVVRIENPAAGNYRIQVTVSNLLSANQDFALVVTGALTSGLMPVP